MSVITKDQAGTYRQIAYKVRIEHPGRPHRENSRPRTVDTRRYLDSDDSPTLVKLEVGDLVDLDYWLANGTVQPWTPPAAKKGGS